MKTRDVDIRKFLQIKLKCEYQEDPDTKIIDELGLCQGEARIDIAVVNGFMHGYEIKSESDTLDRLPSQINVYNKVLDTVTVITGRCHICNIVKLIPCWWGLKEVEQDSDEIVRLVTIREPKYNPHVDAFSLVQLLWREEAIDVLKEIGLEKGFLSKPRRIIWERLAQSIPLNTLQYLVREKIKSRKNWRVVQQQT